MTFKNFVTGFLIVVLLLTLYVIQAGFVVVHVKSREANIWVPVPIAMGQLVGAFINFPLHYQSEFEKALEYREAVTEILSQLKDLPDTDLVEVTRPHEHVRISKRGDSLWIDVKNAQEKVQVRLPLRTAEQFLRAFNHETVNVGEVMASIGSQPAGDIVYVQTGQEEVRVAIW